MKAAIALVLSLATLLIASSAGAHGVDDATREFLQENRGAAVVPFLYIGAKHMVTVKSPKGFRGGSARRSLAGQTRRSCAFGVHQIRARDPTGLLPD